MARRFKSHRPPSKTQLRALWKKREKAAILAYATADDEDEEEDAIAIALLCHHKQREARSRKFGVRGAYDAVRVEEFYRSLVMDFSDKRFKAWAR
jgi:hypothetical protein